MSKSGGVRLGKTRIPPMPVPGELFELYQPVIGQTATLLWLNLRWAAHGGGAFEIDDWAAKLDIDSGEVHAARESLVSYGLLEVGAGGELVVHDPLPDEAFEARFGAGPSPKAIGDKQGRGTASKVPPVKGALAAPGPLGAPGASPAARSLAVTGRYAAAGTFGTSDSPAADSLADADSYTAADPFADANSVVTADPIATADSLASAGSHGVRDPIAAAAAPANGAAQADAARRAAVPAQGTLPAQGGLPAAGRKGARSEWPRDADAGVAASPPVMRSPLSKRRRNAQMLKLVEEKPGNEMPLNEDMQAVVQIYHKRIGMMGPTQYEKLRFWVEEKGMEGAVVALAIEETVQSADVPRIQYLEGILRNWFNDGIRTLADVHRQKRASKVLGKAEGKEGNGVPEGVPNAGAYQAVNPEWVAKWKELYPDEYDA